MKKIFILLIIIIFSTILTGAANPYKIFIDGEDAKIYLLKDGNLEKTFSCAVGKESTPSPIGTFKIVQKDYWGSGFGGRWMGLSCTWGKFGIHGTIFPNSIGWNSSKGCFRMFNDDVAELFDIVPLGTPVTIQNGPYGDFGKGFRYINPGEYGSDVLRIQKRLASLGYYGGYEDGKYGDILKNAVHRFQRDNSLPVSNTISPAMQEKLGFILME